MYLVNPYVLWPLPEVAGSLSVRRREKADIPAIRRMMASAYPPPHGPEAVWAESTLLAHLNVFPEGQWVALEHGQVVGSATSMRVSAKRAMAPHTWAAITGRGLLTTHEADGDVLYGVNVVVDPEHQGRGIARMLYEARFNHAQQLGCKWIVAGARIPGYHEFADKMTPSEYVGAVVHGSIFDPTLSKQLKMGFNVWGMLPHYTLDHETLDNAALIIRPVQGTHAL